MKKAILIIIVLTVGIVYYVGTFYNSCIGLNEKVAKSWGDVQTAYQRRNDLIGNLVKTVQGAADFEKETLTAVIEARAKATSVKIDPSNITPEQLEQFNKSQSGLSGALSRLLVSVERYPDLKANQNFLKLQDELASTENQILTARTRYNETIEPYNLKVKWFPGNILAGMFNFEERPYFKADEKSQKAPEINFDFKK